MKRGQVLQIPLLIILNIVTCGLFYYYWIYKTSNEIKEFTGREDINPLFEVLLGFFTLGIYFKYWYYKYGKIVYREMPLKVGMDNTEDKTIILVLIDLLVYFYLFFNIIFTVINLVFLDIFIIYDYANKFLFIFKISPFIITLIANIPSLILQDKLNNIWKKTENM